MNQRRRIREDKLDEAEIRERGIPAAKHPRRTDRMEVMSRIEDLLVNLGDYRGDRDSVQGRIEDLSYLVSDVLPSHKPDILRTLVECISRQSMQSGAYATFLGLVNVRDYEFGAQCVNCLMQQLLKSLHEAQWVMARSLMMLLADLVNTSVVTVASMLQLLTDLVNVCEEENSPQRRRDFYAYLVLSPLPLIGRELYEKREMAFQMLIKRLQLYMNKDRCAGEGATLLRIWYNGEMPQHEYLVLLWQQILRLDRDHWIEKQLLRPYLAFDDTLSTALQHHLPILEPPGYQPENVSYPRPWLIFHLFELSDSPSTLRLPEELDIERHVIESHILEILQLHHLERKTCAELLSSYIVSKPDLAVEHCIVEVLLGQMLQLPSPPYLTINYGSIIIELCKLRPNSFPQVVAQAADILFTQLEFMNVSSLDRFVNWFSHHLSNFRYQWCWQDWESCTTVPDLHPSAMFVRELLKKCMRLSYHQHIVQLLPQSYAALIPLPPDPIFKYINELLPGAKLAKQLLEAIRGKSSALAVGGFIEASTELDENIKINVMMQTFLHLGSKSFTHVFSIFSKFQPVMKMLAYNKVNQLAILEALSEVWLNNDQLQLVVAEKLLKIRIVDANVIVDWIFGQKHKLTHMYLWELLNLVIKFTKNHSQDNDEEQLSNLCCFLLNIVQSCVKVVAEHEQTFEQKEMDYWSDWVLGRLQGVLFNYIDDFRLISFKLRQIASELDNSKRLVKLIENYLAYIQ
ncbi:nuclear cap-binding protein subunit 1-like [Drosophila innubila]|uniref:nuclear cap-binding protein subunit 1-like n=1 Tax=Drosophila innubila TaxID=198719 RepID=UPI00148D549B|nr:nuclear cap-binding protein subunit 1-like [Drosophila innubila]